MSSIYDDLGLDPSLTNEPNEFNLDPYAGYTYRGKEIFDQSGVINQIDSGRSQDVSDGVITYAFFDFTHALGLNNNPSFGEGRGYSEFSDAQKVAAREAIGMWDDLIAASFVEAEDTPGASNWAKKGAVDIWLANTTTGPAQAWAYYPGYEKQYERVAGDTWIASPEVNWTNEWFTPGGYGNTTLIHELGHSTGLSHPGSYNGAGATNYLNQAEYAQDSMQYSIMSYWSGAETGASTVNWTLFLNNYAQTPMLHDILTAQTKYGADPTTRVGDTTYGFNSNAGRDIFDFSQNPNPYLAIYDAGGNDTLDLSGYSASQFVNLQPGTFSSVGDAIPSFEEINAARVADGFAPITQTTYNNVVNGRNASVAAKILADTGVSGIVASAYDNLSIAYNTVIENAVGGSARDVLWGNDFANRLEGRGGDDVLQGFGGDDFLTGGVGADIFVIGSQAADGAADLSTDTVVDFETGVDTLDLSAFDGLTLDGVTWNDEADTLSIDLDGDSTTDLTVIINGSFTTDDILFG